MALSLSCKVEFGPSEVNRVANHLAWGKLRAQAKQEVCNDRGYLFLDPFEYLGRPRGFDAAALHDAATVVNCPGTNLKLLTVC